MSEPSSIGEKWTAFNKKVDTFVASAEEKIDRFSKSNPKIALILKIITALALAAIALSMSPITTAVGLGIGATVGFIFSKHVQIVKEKVIEFYNNCSGLGKIGLLAAGVLFPVATPLTFGFVGGGLAGATARNFVNITKKVD